VAKKGLVFKGNKKPLSNESFLYKKLYSFIPLFDTYYYQHGRRVKRTVKTFIELEIYDYKICVISFYNEGFGGTGKAKYRVRCKLGPGHIKAIVRACINAYFMLVKAKGHHAFVFSASDDPDDHREHNKRYTLYTRYIDDNFEDRHKYEEDGSIRLNTFKLVHEDYEFKKQSAQFFEEFEQRVEDEMNSPDTDDCK